MGGENSVLTTLDGERTWFTLQNVLLLAHKPMDVSDRSIWPGEDQEAVMWEYHQAITILIEMYNKRL